MRYHVHIASLNLQGILTPVMTSVDQQEGLFRRRGQVRMHWVHQQNPARNRPAYLNETRWTFCSSM